jgi:hypothetical protein
VALQDAMRDPDSFVIERVFTFTNKAGVEFPKFVVSTGSGNG